MWMSKISTWVGQKLQLASFTKMTEKVESIIVWRLFYERFHENNPKIEKCEIPTTKRARTNIFLNEPELTISYIYAFNTFYLHILYAF